MGRHPLDGDGCDCRSGGPKARCGRAGWLNGQLSMYPNPDEVTEPELWANTEVENELAPLNGARRSDGTSDPEEQYARTKSPPTDKASVGAEALSLY